MPNPSSLSIQIVPLQISTIFFAIDKPKSVNLLL